MLRVEISGAIPSELLEAIEQRLSALMEAIHPPQADSFEQQLPDRSFANFNLSAGTLIAKAAIELQRWLGHPVGSLFVQHSPAEPEKELIAFEYCIKPSATDALRLAYFFLQQCTSTAGADKPACQTALEQFQAKNYDLKNSAAYLRLARKRNIPYRSVTEDGMVLAFGQGAMTKRIRGSFTQATSYIATNLSTNKHTTGKILREHGIPVPRQIVVMTASEARDAARQLGFPLVAKPVASDRGTAVNTNLTNENDVQAAFHRARAYGPALIESHLPGDHYRLTVINGKLISARRQLPASITGNGTDTIARLVEAKNTQRLKENLWPIKLDQDTDEYIARAGLQRGSIVKQGETVHLRGQSNLVLGGSMDVVTGIVHPDNARLAIRTAAIMGIDAAGLDFLSPDISKSYLEVGGGFCEINVTPAFMFNEREVLFDTWFPNGSEGRVYTMATIGVEESIVETFAKSMSQNHPKFSWASKSGFHVDAHLVSNEPQDHFEGTRRALQEPGITAALIELSLSDIVEHGLSTDRIDTLIYNPSYIDQIHSSQIEALELVKSISQNIVNIEDIAAVSKATLFPAKDAVPAVEADRAL